MPKLRRIADKFQKISNYFKPMSIPIHSANTSFFLILSLFPALLLILGVLRYTSLEIKDLIGLIEGFLPEALLPTAQHLIESSYRHTSGTVVSVSVVAALWSASRGMYGLLGGLNAVYGIQDQRGYWLRRILSVVYTFAFLILLLLTLVLYVFGNTIMDYLWMTTKPVLMFLMNIIDFRFILLLLLQSSLFTAIYALLPKARHGVKDSLPGAVVASLGWLIFSNLFSVYVEHFSNYSNIFGSIYALALGMLWLYFCICIFFYGAALNRFLEEYDRHGHLKKIR